jgi:glyoxylase-like metal-dependent hydrolase (beta-lactamase superfamily II)
MGCMNLGSWELDSVSGGTWRLDGGAFFGMVPKPLWEKHFPADERNRVRANTNCLLARDGRHTVLIDTGYGGKLSQREREIYDAQPGEPLVEDLAAKGVLPEQIDTVVLSHLHFDHAGGGSRRDERGELMAVFPKARYVVQAGEWADATSGAPELEGAYPLENILPLKEAGQLELIDGDVEILPGLRALVTSGHTRCHQALLLSSEGQAAIFLGDLCPTSAHLRRMWHLGYDVYPLETRRRKPQILGQAADEGWLVLFDHDPDIVAARLARDAKREFLVVESWQEL